MYTHTYIYIHIHITISYVMLDTAASLSRHGEIGRARRGAAIVYYNSMYIYIYIYIYMYICVISCIDYHYY